LNNTKLEKQTWLSKEIIKKAKYHLDKKDQVLFFLNRRGFSPHVLCNKCFTAFTCPNCSINLVFHKKKTLFFVTIVALNLLLIEIAQKKELVILFLVVQGLREFQKK
jgi:Primosomal protein N'' (replication factor Y) - superfamily II helicase